MMLGEREVPLLTDADRVVRNVIDAGEEHRVLLPLSVSGYAAVLRGRAIRPKVLDVLGLASRAREVPIHEIARASW